MVVLGCSIALVISYELVYGDAGKCLPWRRQVDELRADAEVSQRAALFLEVQLPLCEMPCFSGCRSKSKK